MVVWEDGQMKKSDYRKFIRDVIGVDDFASMREVVTRRYSGFRKTKDGKKKMPSLLLIDGGSASCMHRRALNQSRSSTSRSRQS
jgi:excinuclease ABC subunit C